MKAGNVSIDEESIRQFCREHRVVRLALFGSALREDFTAESDVDVLVEFEPDTRVGLLRLARIENELSQILGRRVDMNTVTSLSRYFRDSVVDEAECIYDATR